MPTVEIVQFPGSDEFVADQLVFKDCLDILLKSEGCISPYYGIQTDDNRSGYLFVIWETYDHHMNLTKSEAYPALISSLKRAQSGPLNVQHVDFDDDAALVLGAPATEIVYLMPKPDTDETEFKDLIAKLQENLKMEKSCHSVLFGESRENKGTWFMLLGWDSVKAHVDAVSRGVFPELIKKLHALNKIELTHSNLTKYTGQ